MRSVIVNSVRDRRREKRGGDWMAVTLSTEIASNVPEGGDTILKVHEALSLLEQAHPRLAQVAESARCSGTGRRREGSWPRCSSKQDGGANSGAGTILSS
jgi:hypothetical protein